MIRSSRRAVLAALAAIPALPFAARAATHEVRISNFAFSPAALAAAPGDTVVFVNADSRPHTATANDASFDTGRIRPGERAQVRVAGPTDYVCRFHPRMRGTISSG